MTTADEFLRLIQYGAVLIDRRDPYGRRAVLPALTHEMARALEEPGVRPLQGSDD